MQLTPKDIILFQQKILLWYAEHKRKLPWREIPFAKVLQVRDPYKILISEIMSQQTQIDRVIPKYEAWLKRFPTTETLAKAPLTDVLAYWSGLGYNRRALNLKKTAEIIVANYTGKFPRDEKLLLALPGIGPYTARAILCFAFNQQIAVIDTNVRKVILTQFSFKQAEVTEKEIEQIAVQLLPKDKAYEWNQALMDYASAVLKKEKIKIPKQSKFMGSHRYYRGQVLKVLLAKKKVRIDELGKLIKKEYIANDRKWLEELLVELEREGFILRTPHHISLKR